METKRCRKCGEEKLLDEFYKDRSKEYGRSGWCKECGQKRYREKNKKRETREGYKFCSKCGEEKPLCEFVRRKDSKDGFKGYCKICNNLQKKQYRENNIEKVRAQRRKSYEANKEQIARNRRIRYNEEPVFRLLDNLRKGLRRVVKTGSKTAALKLYLGCTPVELKQYIEKQFKKGMCWENYGFYTWHLDHIIPMSTIKSEDDVEQIKIVCHYTNLQPLWAEENYEKGDKYTPKK